MKKSTIINYVKRKYNIYNIHNRITAQELKEKIRSYNYYFENFKPFMLSHTIKTELISPWSSIESLYKLAPSYFGYRKYPFFIVEVKKYKLPYIFFDLKYRSKIKNILLDIVNVEKKHRYIKIFFTYFWPVTDLYGSSIFKMNIELSDFHINPIIICNTISIFNITTLENIQLLHICYPKNQKQNNFKKDIIILNDGKPNIPKYVDIFSYINKLFENNSKKIINISHEHFKDIKIVNNFYKIYLNDKCDYYIVENNLIFKIEGPIYFFPNINILLYKRRNTSFALQKMNLKSTGDDNLVIKTSQFHIFNNILEHNDCIFICNNKNTLENVMKILISKI